MVVKSCFHWAGHVIRMADSCPPKQLFYDEMCNWKRKASKKRFKESVKICLRQFRISMNQWEKNETGLKSVAQTNLCGHRIL